MALTEKQRERNRKAKEAIRKKTKELNAFNAKRQAEEKADLERRRTHGRMTPQEEREWANLSKEERRVIEQRLENEARKKPLLSEKLARDRKEAQTRYDSGQMTPEEKAKHEANKPEYNQFRRLNPHLKYDAAGNPIFPTKEFFEETPGYHLNMPTKTDEQAKFMDLLLDLSGQQLPGLINQMQQPVSMDIFSHMTNPILRKMANPQVLFPSQMQNQSYSGLEGLLGELGSQGVQQLMNKAPDIWDFAQQNAPAAYDYAASSRPGQFVQGLPGNVMNILSSLGNRFRPQQ